MDKRKDYIPFGSEAHAQHLGLRKLDKDEKSDYACQGYTLVDTTQWGPNALPSFINAQLIQRVHELTTKPEVPKEAQPMWTP